MIEVLEVVHEDRIVGLRDSGLDEPLGVLVVGDAEDPGIGVRAGDGLGQSAIAEVAVWPVGGVERDKRRGDVQLLASATLGFFPLGAPDLGGVAN